MKRSPPYISTSVRTLLEKLFEETTSTDSATGVSAIHFRASNEEYRETLDELERLAIVIKDNNYYRLHLKALTILPNKKSAQLLEIMSKILPLLRDLYKKQPGQQISIDYLSEWLDSSRDSIIEALLYFKDAPVWGGYSTDLRRSEASVNPSESILNYKNFDEMLDTLWNLHESTFGDIQESFSELNSYNQPESGDKLQKKSVEHTEEESGDSGEALSVALADRPANKSEDSLAYSIYAAAIADFLTHKNTKPPISMAIVGEWGSGKSTLMKWIRDDIESRDPETKTIWFSAWRHTEKEEVWAALAKTIIASIGKGFGARNELRLARLNREFPGFNKYLFTALLLGGVSFIEYGSEFINILFVLSTAFVGIYTAVMGFKGAFGSPVLKILRSTKGPDYEAKLGFQAEFEKDLSIIIDIATKNNRALFIFIDDLDRSPPPVPAKVFEAINILSETEKCNFIIGLDIKPVAASIEARYQQVVKIMNQNSQSMKIFTGENFIEKIVQLQFVIPENTDEIIANYAEKLLGISHEKKPEAVQQEEGNSGTVKPNNEIDKVESGSVIEEMVEIDTLEDSPSIKEAVLNSIKYLPNNPRKIKRFVNSFRLVAYIANRRGLIGNEGFSLDTLAATLVSSMEYPAIYSMFISKEYPVELDRLINYYANYKNRGNQYQDEYERECQLDYLTYKRNHIHEMALMMYAQSNREQYISLSQVVGD